MNKLVLKLEGKVIELGLHNTEAGMLYKSQDLLKGGLGYDVIATKRAIDNWSRSEKSKDVKITSLTEDTKDLNSKCLGEEVKGVNFTTLTLKGKYGGTYLTQEQLFSLAAYVSSDFHKAVFEAFTAAAQGDGKKAVDIATSVAIPPELLDREKLLRLQMNTLLANEAVGDQRKLTNLITNFNRLIGKAVSGYAPKELTGDNGKSALEYIVDLGHLEGVGAYLATMELIIAGLFAKLDYHTIALMLRVETSKNKDTVSKLV